MGLHAPVAPTIGIRCDLDAGKTWMTANEGFLREKVFRIGLTTRAVQDHEQGMSLTGRPGHANTIAHSGRVTGPIEVVTLPSLIVAAHQFGRDAIIGALASHLTIVIDTSAELGVTPRALLAIKACTGCRHTGKIFGTGILSRAVGIFQARNA